MYMQDHYLSPEVHGGIVYDHYLFDIPKILDLCVLYGEGNRPLLSKMITNLFESQPKYVEDWCSTIKSLLLVSAFMAITNLNHLSLSPPPPLSLPLSPFLPLSLPFSFTLPFFRSRYLTKCLKRFSTKSLVK